MATYSEIKCNLGTLCLDVTEEACLFVRDKLVSQRSGGAK